MKKAAPRVQDWYGLFVLESGCSTKPEIANAIGISATSRGSTINFTAFCCRCIAFPVGQRVHNVESSTQSNLCRRTKKVMSDLLGSFLLVKEVDKYIATVCSHDLLVGICSVRTYVANVKCSLSCASILSHTSYKRYSSHSCEAFG